MTFVYAIAAVSLILCALLGFSVWSKRKDKEALKSFKTYLSRLIDGAFALGLCLIIAIVTLFSGGVSWLNAMGMYLMLAGLVFCLKPSRMFSLKKEGQKPSKKKIALATVLLVGLGVELGLFSGRSFKSYGPQSEALPETFLVHHGVEEDGTLLLEENSYFVIECGKTEYQSIRFNYVAKERVAITVNVASSNDDGHHWSHFNSYEMDGLNEDFHLVALPKSLEEGNLIKFEFRFGDHYLQNDRTIALRSITFNAKPRLYFGLARFAFFSTCAALLFYGPTLIGKLKKKSEPRRIPYLIIGTFALAGLIAAFAATLANKDGLFLAYPLTRDQLQSSEVDIYVRLFDALKKGQTNLDVIPDERLLALENPYSPEARNAAHAYYLWDHAFYKGNYYCYYGILPVLLVSFPLYWMSGGAYVPNAFALEIIGMAALVPAFLLLVLEIYRFVRKDVSYPAYILLGAMGLITSMTLAAITFKDGGCHEAIYHVPDIYGLLCFDLFLFFVLRAFRKTQWRTLELGFSGFFFVLMVAARPNLIVAAVIAAPFYLGMLIRRECNWKRKLVQFGTLFAILAVGGALICWYNYARFESITEFGQSYQLNVTDQRTLTYSKEKLLPFFVHFFAQAPVYYDRFPFVSCSVIQYTWDQCPYVSGYYGVLMIPSFGVALLMPFAFWNEKLEQKMFGLLVPAMAFLFAYTTYSKAGICARYLIEQYHIMTLAFIFLVLQITKRNENAAPYPWLVASTFGLGTLSAFLCLCLSFDTFDGMNSGDMNGLLLLCKAAFHSFYV